MWGVKRVLQRYVAKLNKTIDRSQSIAGLADSGIYPFEASFPVMSTFGLSNTAFFSHTIGPCRK
jgi:hypothetical protein